MRTERELVQLFAHRDRQLEALRGLAGGVTATYLRTARLTDGAFEAVVEGLHDPNPRIRWWCVQLLDHTPDPRAVEAIVRVLDDPVPRVRRNAAHALGCIGCKPAWDRAPPRDAVETLSRMASTDANVKVRNESARALACVTTSDSRGGA
jgi:HEAT repeat protein